MDVAGVVGILETHLFLPTLLALRARVRALWGPSFRAPIALFWLGYAVTVRQT